jgi:hypothetical protein
MAELAMHRNGDAGFTQRYISASSSRAGWPETCTKWSFSVMISTPRRMQGVVQLADGMLIAGYDARGEDAGIPGSRPTSGCSSRAMRARAERGSPWLPVQIISTRSRGR